MTRSNDQPDQPRNATCWHNESRYDVSPYDGDVWCFACNPPRNLSEDARRMDDALLQDGQQ